MPFQLWFFFNVTTNISVISDGDFYWSKRKKNNKLLKEKLSENHQRVTTCGQYQDELHVNRKSGGDRICIQLLIAWAIQPPEQ